MDEVKEQLGLRGFGTHPENINKLGAPDADWRWREVFIRQVALKKGEQDRRTLMADRMIEEVIEKGNVQAFKEIADRMEGKAPQGIGTLDPDGKFQPQNLVVLYGGDDSTPSTET